MEDPQGKDHQSLSSKQGSARWCGLSPIAAEAQEGKGSLLKSAQEAPRRWLELVHLPLVPAYYMSLMAQYKAMLPLEWESQAEACLLSAPVQGLVSTEFYIFR